MESMVTILGVIFGGFIAVTILMQFLGRGLSQG